MFSDSRRSFHLWCIAIVILLGWLGWLLRAGLKPDTNLLSLLPQSERDPVMAETVDRFTRELSQKTVFLISHPQAEQAEQASSALIAELEQGGLFTRINGRMEETGKATYELYFPFRYQLLPRSTHSALTAGQFEAMDKLIKQSTESIYNPTSSLFGRILEQDPLLLFPHFLEGLPRPPGELKVRNGFLSIGGSDRYSILISADAVGESFARKQQKQTTHFLDQLFAKLKTNTPGLALDATGVILYAAAGSAAAEKEISTIGIGSMLGVVLLFLLVFRGPRPLFLGLLPLVVGLAFALAATLAVFGRIHAMTLGFGASMIGICIDYTFHYFSELSGNREDGPKAALQHILPAISLGALTSILGYLGLFIAPFPGLRQMALFSSAGLLGAFVTVVLVYPHLSGTPKPVHAFATRLAARYLRFWSNLDHKILIGAGVLLLPFLAIGIWRLEGDDDIRRLQTPSASLLAQEQAIRKVVGHFDTSRFMLVEGASVEELLQREERLGEDLSALQHQGRLGFFQGVSAMVPSKSRQLANHQLLNAALVQQSTRLTTYCADLGFEPAVEQAAASALAQTPSRFLTLEDWLTSQASAPLRHLWLGPTQRGFASVVVLGDIEPGLSLAELASQHQGVAYIDKVDAISRLMHRYRILGGELVAWSYLVIFLLLLYRYGLKRGLLAALPPILAAALALALFGWLGHPLNLFNVLALLLVLGVGIDYSIFFAEAGGARPSTMLAVLLSATTTLLSFGLLALSATPVLQAFGLTVLFGIAAGWLLSPLAARGNDLTQA